MSAKAIPIDLMNIAFDATYKIDALTKALLGLGPTLDAAEHEMVAHELASRIAELNLVVMSVLGSDSAPADPRELYLIVHQQPMPLVKEVCHE